MFKKLCFTGIFYLMTNQTVFAFDWVDSANKFDELSLEEKEQQREFLKSKGWISTSKSNEFISSINYNYIKPRNSVGVEAWLKIVVFNDITKDGLTVGDYKMNHSIYDCKNRTIKFVSSTSYKASTGNVLDSYTDSYSTATSVIPDSVGEANLNAICYAAYIKQN